MKSHSYLISSISCVLLESFTLEASFKYTCCMSYSKSRPSNQFLELWFGPVISCILAHQTVIAATMLSEFVRRSFVSSKSFKCLILIANNRLAAASYEGLYSRKDELTSIYRQKSRQRSSICSAASASFDPASIPRRREKRPRKSKGVTDRTLNSSS